MSRIAIRFAKPRDALRLVRDGVVGGAVPAGDSWPMRITKWQAEVDAGRRAILVAEQSGNLIAMVQLVFRFPPGYSDPEAANGRDVAMLDTLRARTGAPLQVLDQLVTDAQIVAKNHGVTTVTLCLPLNNDRAIVQAKSWGFVEFRMMPEGETLLAFFRRQVE